MERPFVDTFVSIIRIVKGHATVSRLSIMFPDIDLSTPTERFQSLRMEKKQQHTERDDMRRIVGGFRLKDAVGLTPSP